MDQSEYDLMMTTAINFGHKPYEYAHVCWAWCLCGRIKMDYPGWSEKRVQLALSSPIVWC